MRRARAAAALLPALLLAALLAPHRAHAHVVGHDRGIPILLYHVINEAPAGEPFPELFVPPRVFAEDMSWLARHGYHAITLQRAYDYWTTGAPIPRHPVVISFDDGYLSQFTHAFPVLEAHHWPGVLNMEVNFLRPATGLRPWRIRVLLAAGWELDAHTLTHPDLTTLDETELRRQVAGSRAVLRRLFHVPVDFFCYPAGRYNDQVVAEVRRAGFLGATTTMYGLARPPDYYTLDRIRIDGSDGLVGFAEKLTRLRTAPASR
jgi:peptidoglycan/xylan/chitin deacetylase (PgdA/CDA1 family)